MGIQGLWKFLLKTGYSPGVVQIPTGNLLPRGRLYHVDLAGILYSDIRGAYRNADYEVANKIMDVSLVRQGFHKDSTAIYIDGPPPAQKMTARELREKKHGNDTLSRNPPPFNVASREGKRVEKSPYTHLSRSLFYPFHEKGESLARYLAQKDWCAIACPSEADIAIGEACGKEDIVITSDSDALAYANIHTIWRPFDGGYLVYEVPKVLQHLSLSRVSLTALAVVCSNDYTKKVISMKANLEILKSLETKASFGNVDTMVKSYVSVVGKGLSKARFDPALDIFDRLRYTPLVPDARVQLDPALSQKLPCGTIQQVDALRQEMKKSEMGKVCSEPRV